MLHFTRSELFDLLRFVIIFTTDERIMLRAWKLYRSKTSAPLCHMMFSRRGRAVSQRDADALVVEILRDLRVPVRKIAEFTMLHRATVQRHIKRYMALSPDQKLARQAEHDRMRRDVEDQFSERYTELAADAAGLTRKAAIRPRLPPE